MLMAAPPSPLQPHPGNPAPCRTAPPAVRTASPLVCWRQCHSHMRTCRAELMQGQMQGIQACDMTSCGRAHKGGMAILLTTLSDESAAAPAVHGQRHRAACLNRQHEVHQRCLRAQTTHCLAAMARWTAPSWRPGQPLRIRSCSEVSS